MIVALPTLLLPYPILREFIRSYGVTSLWLFRVISGIKVEWRGLEKIPKSSCIIACKHQSSWETFALYAVLRDPIYILKRELMLIPLFGWYTWKARLVPVDRSAGLSALTKMTARARNELDRGCQLSFFRKEHAARPEQNRSTNPALHFSTVRPECRACRWRSIPGLFWPRRSLRRRPAQFSSKSFDPFHQVSTAKYFSHACKACSKKHRQN